MDPDNGTLTRVATRYTHYQLGKDVSIGIAGFYTPYKEVRLDYHGREVLYMVGKAVLESSCCGTGSWLYSVVPGYVVRWHASEENGMPVSEVEPIAERAEQEEVRKIIEDKESADVVSFW